MEKHEGEELRNYLKGKGLEMNLVAKKLGKKRQTVNYHLRKAVLEEDFKRLVKDKLKIDFPLSKSNIPILYKVMVGKQVSSRAVAIL